MDLSEEKVTPGLEKFVEEFFYDRVKELDQIKVCLKKNDLETIRKIAHQWKGFSEPYGFQCLGVLSRTLEHQAENKAVEEVSQLLSEISRYFKLKKSALGLPDSES